MKIKSLFMLSVFWAAILCVAGVANAQSVGALSDIHDFTSDGYAPSGLVQSSNVLYGSLNSGAFSYNPATSAYAKLSSLPANLPAINTVSYGGVTYSIKFGTNYWANIFSHITNPVSPPSDNTYDYGELLANGSVIHTFNTSAGNPTVGQYGTNPAGLTIIGNTLYGVTQFYNFTNNTWVGYGTIFSYNITSKAVTTLYTFSGSDGQYPDGLTADPTGNVLYGTTLDGKLFRYNLNTSSYSDLGTFQSNATSTASRLANYVIFYNNAVYVATYSGGNTPISSSCGAECGYLGGLYEYLISAPVVACTSWTYSAWTPATCPPSGTQTRTVATSSPSGCTGNPPASSLSQTCTPVAVTISAITSPVATDALTTGNQQYIKWNETGETNSTTVIISFKNTSTNAVTQVSASNPISAVSGQAVSLITVPNVSAGKYTVTVTDTSKTSATATSAAFTVVAAVVKPTISAITSPVATDALTTGNQQYIKWNETGETNSTTVIISFKNTSTNVVTQVSANNQISAVSGQAVSLITVPNVSAGTYTVTVTDTSNSSATATSAAFKVVVAVTTVKVTSITITSAASATTVSSGSTLQMYASVLPANATNKNVTWSATGPATINSSGLMTAGSTAGTATITATAQDGSGVAGIKQITITSSTANIPVSSVTVSAAGGATSVAPGSTLQMNASILPVNATNPSLTWIVINGTGSATISTTGLLSAGSAGTVSVAALTNDKSGVSGSMQINIQAATTAVSITAVTSPVATDNLTVGNQQYIKWNETGETNSSTANIFFKNTTTNVVTPVATNAPVAVSGNQGNILVNIPNVPAGTYTATVTDVSNSGATATSAAFNIVVAAGSAIKVSSIIVSSAGYATVASIGGTLQMNVSVFPSNATNSAVTWSVTGPATINSTGLLTGVSAGAVTVTAAAQDGSGVKGSENITITGSSSNILVTNIGLDGGGAIDPCVYGGSSSPTHLLQMHATITPSNATNPAVIWSASFVGNMATISSTGLLTASSAPISGGTGWVMATAADGSGVTSKIAVTIIPSTGPSNPVCPGSAGPSLSFSWVNPPQNIGLSSITLASGQTNFIQWNSPGFTRSMAVEAILTLKNTVTGVMTNVGNSSVQDFVGAADNGYYWNIPSSISNGTYTLNVADGFNTGINATSAVFNIAAQPNNGGAPSLSLTYPAGGENLVQGQTYNITWSDSNLKCPILQTLPSALAFGVVLDGYDFMDRAYEPTGVITGISGNATNYQWTVPTNFPGGLSSGTNTAYTNVKMELQAYCFNQWDSFGEINSVESPAINITYAPTTSPVTIISPQSRDQIQIGSTDLIKWISKGTATNVNISIQNALGTNSLNQPITIATNVPASQGSYSWKVSPTIGTYEYIMTITDASNPNSVATSYPFQVENNSGFLTNLYVTNNQSVKVGSALQLQAFTEPPAGGMTDETNNVTWSVDNSTLATVSQSGLLTGLNAGSVNVTVTANDGSGLKAVGNITVMPGSPTNVLVTKITITAPLDNPAVGSTLQMSAAVLPTNATNPSVTWSVSNGLASNGTNATINSSTGLLNAGSSAGINNGIVTVTATANDGSGISATYDVFIGGSNNSAESISVQSPSGIETFEQGGTELVEFTCSSVPNVGISVTNTSTKIVTTIASNIFCGTTNGGVYQWSIPANFAAGTYTMAVYSTFDSGISATSPSFQILAAGSVLPSSITSVTSPIAANQWVIGSTYNVVFTETAAEAARQQNFFIMNVGSSPSTWESGYIISQTAAAPNTSSYVARATVTPIDQNNDQVSFSWPIPSYIPAGSYQVEITDYIASGQNFAKSATFQIVTTPSIAGPVTSITVVGAATVPVNTSVYQMAAVVSPTNAINKNVTWSVDRTDLVTINPSTGLLSVGNNPGTFTVTATAQDGSGITGTKTVTITNQTIYVSSITLFGSVAPSHVAGNTVGIGQSMQMGTTTLPNNASNPIKVWSVTNGTGSATIDSSTGLLTPVSVGTVTVKATAIDGSGVSGTEQITITAQPAVCTPVCNNNQCGAPDGCDGICQTGTCASGTCNYGQCFNPFAPFIKGITFQNPISGFLPGYQAGVGVGVSTTSNVTNPFVIFPAVTLSETNGTGSATITPIDQGSGMFVVTALTPGTVTVTATAKDGSGITATDLITINAIPSSVKVTNIVVSSSGVAVGLNIPVPVNTSLQMNAYVLPDTAANKALMWSVDRTDLATINPSTGLLTTVAPGTVNIKATAQDGSGVFGTDQIIVTSASVKVTNITISAPSSVSVGTAQLVAVATPANATNSAVTWSVANGTGTATINSSTGLLRAISSGTITVMATANDGSGVTGTAQISITAASSGCGVGESYQTDPQDCQYADVCQTIYGSNFYCSTNDQDRCQTICNALGKTADYGNSYVITNPGVNFYQYSSINIYNSNGVLTGSIPYSQCARTSYTNTSTDVCCKCTTAACTPSCTNATCGGSDGCGGTCQTGTCTSGTCISGVCSSVVSSPVTSITVSSAGSVTTVAPGSTLQFTATVLPANATNPAVTWSVVDNTGTATISPAGLLTAGVSGTVTVTATAQDGSGVTGTQQITLKASAPTVVSSITMVSPISTTKWSVGRSNRIVWKEKNVKYVSISLTNTATPTATPTVIFDKVSASRGYYLWKLPQTLTSGTYTITVTSLDDSTVSATSANFQILVLVTGITVSGTGSETIVAVGSTLQMVAAVVPTGASNPAVTWSISSGTKYATIDATAGILTATKVGTVTVRATATDASKVRGSVRIKVTAVSSTQVACTSWTYSDWDPATCPTSGTQARAVATSSPSGCTGNPPASALSQTCTPTNVACTSWTYSDWGVCGSAGVQVRNVLTYSPSGCTGGSPITTQNCIYNPATAAQWVPFGQQNAYMGTCTSLCKGAGGTCAGGLIGNPDLSGLTTSLYKTIYDCTSIVDNVVTNSDTYFCPCSAGTCTPVGGVVASNGVIVTSKTCCAGLIAVWDWKNKVVSGDVVMSNRICETPVANLNCADKGSIPGINGLQACCPGLFGRTSDSSCQTLACINSGSGCVAANRCGNNFCEPNLGETADNCPYDCAS